MSKNCSSGKRCNATNVKHLISVIINVNLQASGSGVFTVYSVPELDATLSPLVARLVNPRNQSAFAARNLHWGPSGKSVSSCDKKLQHFSQCFVYIYFLNFISKARVKVMLELNFKKYILKHVIK